MAPVPEPVQGDLKPMTAPGMEDDEFYVCACGHGDHIVRLIRSAPVPSIQGDVPEMYLDVHLHTGPFWHRVRLWLRYLFRTENHNWGQWDEFVLDAPTTKKMIAHLQRHVDECEKFEKELTRGTP